VILAPQIQYLIALDKYLLHTYIFENEWFPPTMVQQRKYVCVVGYSTLFNGLMSKFAVDILQIASGCIQIRVFSGLIAFPWLWVW
jgi:hypothetical protein